MQISSQRQQQPLPPSAIRGAQPTVQRPTTNPMEAKGQVLATPPTTDGPSRADVASNVARLDGLADALMERFSAAAQDAPESERPAFREAYAALESGLSRLRAGLSDGSLQPSDIQRGVGNVFKSVSGVLETARKAGAADGTDTDMGTEKATDMGTEKATEKGSTMGTDGMTETDDAPSMGDVVRARFSGLADSVMARLQNVEMPDKQREAMAQGVAEAFASATSRLDAALFNPVSGQSIDRGTYQELFTASLGALQDQLAQIFAGGEESSTNGGVVYGADRSKQGMASTGRSLDLAG